MLSADMRPATRLLRRIKVHSFLKLLVTIGIGAVLGFLAVALALCTEGLKSWKNSIARSIIHDGAPHGILRAAIFHSGYSTGLILIGSCLVSPDAVRIYAGMNLTGLHTCVG